MLSSPSGMTSQTLPSPRHLNGGRRMTITRYAHYLQGKSEREIPEGDEVRFDPGRLGGVLRSWGRDPGE